MPIENGCSFCFRSFDSKDSNVTDEAVVVCFRCGALHHATCWHQVGACTKCNFTRYETTGMRQIIRYESDINKTATNINSSIIVYLLTSNIDIQVPDTVSEFVPHYFQVWQPRIVHFLRHWHAEATKLLRNYYLRVSRFLYEQNSASETAAFIEKHVEKIVEYSIYILLLLLIYASFGWFLALSSRNGM